MITIAAIGPGDWPAVVALNNAATPHVNALGEAQMRRLGAEARLALRATADREIAGFVLALAPGADYASPNYRWFAARYRDFLYVDRVAVASRWRGRGIAWRLYEAVFAAAGAAPVCCEVNLRPANDTSMRFHLGLGFVEVGRQMVEDGAKEVALLAASPPAATPPRR
ncbi:MAG: acetyltransferase [Alphaproteobacteria bacterium]|nr:MAG: acetyltransferase [Alphaproteobacteria bacterium]